MKKQLSQLTVGEVFKLIDTAHSTLNGFIYKIKPDDVEFITWKVIKVNKTTVVCENQNMNAAPIYFKFTTTGHWRSDGKNCFVELIECLDENEFHPNCTCTFSSTGQRWSICKYHGKQ